MNFDALAPMEPMPTPVTIEKLRLASQAGLSRSVAESCELSVIEDRLTQNLVYSLRAEVQAQRIAEGTVTETAHTLVETPATTWQMFKSRHAESWWLRWLVRRRPVRMTEHRRTVTLTATWTGWAKFPDSTLVIDTPALGRAVFFLQRDTDLRIT